MTTPWWQSSIYSQSRLQPPIDLDALAGPRGPAYVQVYDDGSTAPGWGEKTFMSKYLSRTFHARRAEAIHNRYDDAPFALIMRSVRMVCIDIDGKNGGLASAASLVLPVTLAETSKSGNGYHLFYTVDDTWDAALGFAAVRDKIGFMQGVDLRGVGCVFHHAHQQWNQHQPVPLPDHILDKINQRSQTLDQSVQRIRQILSSEDPEEILIMQDHVQSQLSRPIPAGKRNNTLFAIGAEMHQAQVPGWEKQIYDKGIEIGLSDEELEKLLKNIRRYG